MADHMDSRMLDTIFEPCRQCGTCCRRYRKIPLTAEEAVFIEKMGGHVGVHVSMAQIRELGLEEAGRRARAAGMVHMIHPDDKGCVFLQRRNGLFTCRIYHHRPQVCRGFRCNLADATFLDLFGSDATSLLGQDAFGLPLVPGK